MGTSLGSPFSNILIPILFYDIFLISTFTFARYSMDGSPPLTDIHPSNRQPENLKTSPQLFCQDDINNLKDSSLIAPAPRLVEYKFKFPFLPGSDASIEDLRHHAGYYKLEHTKGATMFYFFFESRRSSADPVVIWLNGGPGASSSVGLFYENGPFHITNELKLKRNEYSWHNVSNIIYIDQPIGTGFSYTTDDDDIRSNTIDAANDLYNFLQEFFDAHNDFASNEFFITGESFAGHYAPVLATRILLGNKDEQRIWINLKGFAVGNGLTNPGIQHLALPNYAWQNQLITDNDYHFLKDEMAPKCESSAKDCDLGIEGACHAAYNNCDAILQAILEISRHEGYDINYFDIRKRPHAPSIMYDFSKLEEFLNNASVKAVLGVDKEFVHLNYVVYSKMIGDYMKSYDAEIPALLDNGIRVLIYVGEKDLVCNWLGNLRWLHEMQWQHQVGFVQASTGPYEIDEMKVGVKKSYENLTFIKIDNAGHLVPMDQPRVAFHMIKSWMQGEL